MCVMSQPVLVLNKRGDAHNVVTVKRAVCMINTFYKDGTPKAKIININDVTWEEFTWEQWSVTKAAANEAMIRSAHGQHRVPNIIILTRHDKFRKPQVNFNRKTIFQRDNWTCQYCGKKFASSEVNLDHVIPKSQGGKSTWENVVCACFDCNLRKGGRTPKQANMKLLRTPTKPKHTFPYKHYKCKSWEAILGACYWETELQNDNPK